MIGIIAQNNTCLDNLIRILKSVPAEAWRPKTTYEAVLMVSPYPPQLPRLNAPVIALGNHFPRAALHIPTPVRPAELVQKVHLFCAQNRPEITFENNRFIFQKDKRLLLDKMENKQIALTEKECELLAVLAASRPECLSKETLLSRVWNYSSDTETHTVESHIYALRQKLGDAADLLIQSTPNGYCLGAD